MIWLLRTKPVGPESQNFFVEVIFRRFAMHEISYVDHAGTDRLSVGRHRGELTRLNELDLIPFRVFGLKPATPVVRGTKFTEPLHPVCAQILPQAASVLSFIGNASHPAESML